MDEDGAAMWQAYALRKRAERLAEAACVWSAFAGAGGGPDTVVAIDFVHLSPVAARAETLRAQLAENYAVEMQSAAHDYWLVKGTTRPYGANLTADSHVDWVRFMCDVAEGHGCVFSTWSIAAPGLGLVVNSEDFETGA